MKQTREGKKQQSHGKNKSDGFSIFDNKGNAPRKPRPEYNKKTVPLISKAERNELLRSLNLGKEMELHKVEDKNPRCECHWCKKVFFLKKGLNESFCDQECSDLSHKGRG